MHYIAISSQTLNADGSLSVGYDAIDGDFQGRPVLCGTNPTAAEINTAVQTDAAAWYQTTTSNIVLFNGAQ